MMDPEKFLRRALHSTPQQEMEEAGARVLQRLRWEDRKAPANTTESVSAQKSWRLMAAAAAIAGRFVDVRQWA